MRSTPNESNQNNQTINNVRASQSTPISQEHIKTEKSVANDDALTVK